MVAADAQSVAITGNDPNTQVGTSGFQSACYCCRTAMNAMHAIGIHVVREAAATADTGNDRDIFPGDAKRGHDLLHLRQDGVISAAGAPAYFLVSYKILRGKRDGIGHCCCIGHIKIVVGKVTKIKCSIINAQFWQFCFTQRRKVGAKSQRLSGLALPLRLCVKFLCI